MCGWDYWGGHRAAWCFFADKEFFAPEYDHKGQIHVFLWWVGLFSSVVLRGIVRGGFISALPPGVGLEMHLTTDLRNIYSLENLDPKIGTWRISHLVYA